MPSRRTKGGVSIKNGFQLSHRKSTSGQRGVGRITKYEKFVSERTSLHLINHWQSNVLRHFQQKNSNSSLQCYRHCTLKVTIYCMLKLQTTKILSLNHTYMKFMVVPQNHTFVTLTVLLHNITDPYQCFSPVFTKLMVLSIATWLGIIIGYGIIQFLL